MMKFQRIAILHSFYDIELTWLKVISPPPTHPHDREDKSLGVGKEDLPYILRGKDTFPGLNACSSKLLS